jgi:hypothetical protein
VKSLFEVALYALPHVLALLIAMLPTRFEYATLLVGACAFEGWWNLLTEAILVLANRIFGSSVSGCSCSLRVAFLHPASVLESRSSTR